MASVSNARNIILPIGTILLVPSNNVNLGRRFYLMVNVNHVKIIKSNRKTAKSVKDHSVKITK